MSISTTAYIWRAEADGDKVDAQIVWAICPRCIVMNVMVENLFVEPAASRGIIDIPSIE